MTVHVTTCKRESLLTCTAQVCTGSMVLSLSENGGIFFMWPCLLEGANQEGELICQLASFNILLSTVSFDLFPVRWIE